MDAIEAPGLLSCRSYFVFGSNERGFHGAGAAAFAFLGRELQGNWRDCPEMKAAVARQKCGVETVGSRAIWGRGRGPQFGVDGRSYAIATARTPGGYRVSENELLKQFIEFLRYAAREENASYAFVLTRVGGGLARFDHSVLDRLWNAATKVAGGWPTNVVKLY